MKARTVTPTNRIRFRQDAYEDLRSLEKTKKRLEETLYRLQYEQQPFKVDTIVAKTKEKIAATEEEIVQQQQKLNDIEEGVYDKQIQEEISHNAEEIARKREITKAKKDKKKEQKSPQPWVYVRGPPSKYEIDKEYSRFMEGKHKFPRNLAENLKKMPNNTGFLWRGNSFYGQLPEKAPHDVVTMTEKIDLGNGQFEIHEHIYTPTSVSVYRKRFEMRRGRRIPIRERISFQERTRIQATF
jgi:hypothetical protein